MKRSSADPGVLFSNALNYSYGRRLGFLIEKFNVSRQSIWIWRQPGGGVPEEHRISLEILLGDKEKPLLLPYGAIIDDLIRHPARRGPKPAMTDGQNYHLLDLLGRLTSRKEPYFGSSALHALISWMDRPVRGPDIFYRWAYRTGGVPQTYEDSFVSGLMMMNVASLYKLDPPDFEAMVRSLMVTTDNQSSS